MQDIPESTQFFLLVHVHVYNYVVLNLPISPQQTKGYLGLKNRLRNIVYKKYPIDTLTFDTCDSLTGSWSVWPHVVTPQW